MERRNDFRFALILANWGTFEISNNIDHLKYGNLIYHAVVMVICNVMSFVHVRYVSKMCASNQKYKWLESTGVGLKTYA